MDRAAFDKLMHNAGIAGMAASIGVVAYLLLPASASPGKIIACLAIGAIAAGVTMAKRGRA
ncbi:MAG: NAD(P)(+) transhydrogenase (Re/Si-specific) subunit beta [Rhodocyclaceae bacterium]|nr:NAD(P)(+) transhydrogenase (Re/Si-specific) subunit beta [Rhodocyclaceae bacterium]